MLYPSRAAYRHRNGDGYRFIHPISRLYGELPGDITGAIVWIEGETECRLGVVIAATANHQKLMAIGPGWFAFATHKQAWFPGPTPLRTWAQHRFQMAKLPVAYK